MPTWLTALLIAAIASGCTASRAARPGEAELPARHAVERPDWGAAFAAVGAEAGAAVVYDEGSRAVFRYDPERCATRTLPASTFKIFNALVALDTGVLKGPDQVIRWDGLRREIPGWNADLDAATAFRRSAVWSFATRLESANKGFDMVGARRSATNAIFRSLGLPEAPEPR